MFQCCPAYTRKHHTFSDFHFLKTLSSSTPKRWFFQFFITCKFLMYKLKSDHVILVLSKHAQDMQKPFSYGSIWSKHSLPFGLLLPTRRSWIPFAWSPFNSLIVFFFIPRIFVQSIFAQGNSFNPLGESSPSTFS